MGKLTFHFYYEFMTLSSNAGAWALDSSWVASAPNTEPDADAQAAIGVCWVVGHQVWWIDSPSSSSQAEFADAVKGLPSFSDPRHALQTSGTCLEKDDIADLVRVWWNDLLRPRLLRDLPRNNPVVVVVGPRGQP
jgi:hypothetical protein